MLCLVFDKFTKYFFCFSLQFEIGKKETKPFIKVIPKMEEQVKVTPKIVPEPSPMLPVKEPDVKIPPVQMSKANVSVSQLIQKLENSMQHPIVPALATTTYTEDSDDSTDSEQRYRFFNLCGSFFLILKINFDSKTFDQKLQISY